MLFYFIFYRLQSQNVLCGLNKAVVSPKYVCSVCKSTLMWQCFHAVHIIHTFSSFARPSNNETHLKNELLLTFNLSIMKDLSLHSQDILWHPWVLPKILINYWWNIYTLVGMCEGKEVLHLSQQCRRLMHGDHTTPNVFNYSFQTLLFHTSLKIFCYFNQTSWTQAIMRCYKREPFIKITIT